MNGGIVQMTAKNQKRRPEAKPDYELTKRELAVVSRFLNEQAEWAPRVKISGPEDPGVNSIIDMDQGSICMAKSHLKLVPPATVNRTVTPLMRKNADLRTREYAIIGRVSRRPCPHVGGRWR